MCGSRGPGRGRAAGPAAPRALLLLPLLLFLFFFFAGIPVRPAVPAAGRGQAAAGPPLPGPDFAAGWASSGPPRAFTGQDLFNQIDGGAELFLEFGFVRLRLQAYARGRAELTLNAYEMDSAAAALGVYLMKMGRESPFPEIRARNSSEEVQATILKGRYFVQVDNLGEVPAGRGEVAALANAFLSGVAEEPDASPLDRLPAEGRLAGTERLVRGPYGLQPYFTFGEGDILSQGGRVFGALAAYRMPDGRSFTRLIIVYPDAAAAAAALAHLKANLDPYLTVTADRPDGFDFVDYQARKGSVTRSGSSLDITFNAED